MSVSQSAWNNSALNRSTLVKFKILKYVENLPKRHVLLKSAKKISVLHEDVCTFMIYLAELFL
jgi:hypothetical protein